MGDESNLPELRASDAEREAVVSRLRDGVAEGRLTVEEFTSRMELAYDARTHGDLAPLTRDLPAESTASAAVDRPRRRGRRFAIAIFGGSDLVGRWRAAEHIFALTLFGGTDIDLRNAELSGPELTIRAFTIFGGGDVYVPAGLDVEVSGFAIFGGNDEFGLPQPRPGAPLVRVVAFTLFGGFDVWHIPADSQGRPLRELMRALARGRLTA
jgi:hypothetical protein